MLGLGQVKRSIFKTISANRDTLPVLALHKVAEFLDAAYRNEGSDFATNGESRLFKRLAAANFQTVLDVGANVGRWTEAALDYWPNCRVHAFEIAPQTAQTCREKLAAHPQGSRAEVHEFGMSDETGSVEMFYFPDQDELTCTDDRHSKYKSVRFMGKVETIDQFCADKKIDYIDYLKIDVEGTEYKVMHGGKGMIQGGRVGCIQFEYGAFSTDTRFLLKDYYLLLSDKYWIGKLYPKYVDFRDYDWTMEDFRFCNYICVSKDRQDIRRLIERSGSQR